MELGRQPPRADEPVAVRDGAWTIRDDGKIAGYVICFEAPPRASSFPMMLEHWYMVADVPPGNQLHVRFHPGSPFTLEPLLHDGVPFDRGTPDRPALPPESPEPRPSYRWVVTSSQERGKRFQR